VRYGRAGTTITGESTHYWLHHPAFPLRAYELKNSMIVAIIIALRRPVNGSGLGGKE
jgi:hypothetical protein